MELGYRVHKSPPLAPVLNQIHSIHTLRSLFHKINSDFIFPSTPRSSKWSLPIWISIEYFECISHFSHACYMDSGKSKPRLCMYMQLQACNKHQPNLTPTLLENVLEFRYVINVIKYHMLIL